MASMNPNPYKDFLSTRLPDIDELDDRFYDINTVLNVDIDHRGYIYEIDAHAPFRGIASVRAVINILNRDINVIVSDSDLVRLRNSIVFFNEYFCPSKENTTSCKPAFTAYDRVESKYRSMVGRVDKDFDIENPFIDNVLLGIVDEQESEKSYSNSEFDDAIERYMSNQKAQENSIKSNMYGNSGSQYAQPFVRMHTSFCRNMHHDPVDFDVYEKCYENVEYKV